MINLNSNISGLPQGLNQGQGGRNIAKSGNADKSNFGDTVKAVEKYLSKVDNSQKSSDVSISDLISGKNEDVNTMVASVAKADISFKLLVGVRNKLIEAYKQTMSMNL